MTRLGRFFLSSFALATLFASGVAAAEVNAAALAGRWDGSYTAKADKGTKGATQNRELGSKSGATKVLVAVMIVADGEGNLAGSWTTQITKTAAPLEITREGDLIRFTVSGPFPSSWEGKLSADGSTLEGKWHGKSFSGESSAPLNLKRAKN